MQQVFHVLLAMGRRGQAEEVAREARLKTTRSGNVHYWIESTAMDATMAIFDGRLEEALSASERIRVRTDEAGLPGMAMIQATLYGLKVRESLGQSLKEYELAARGWPPLAEAYFCVILAFLGKSGEVAGILDKYVVNRPRIGTDEDETRAEEDAMHLEAAVLAGHKPAADLLLKRFDGRGPLTTGFSLTTCIPRHLGGAAALLERYDEARRHYAEAIRVCTEMRFRPELALTRLQLAELLLDHYPAEKKEALEHLDFAIKEFREMKMRPSLERALRHKDILKA
jgi:tetratricopeptide (TPR) repeat protein